MKCRRPGTDQEFTLTVYANGLSCPEFDLPGLAQADDDTIHCFIPISSGDQITIKGCFKGTCLHGAIDMLADGSFICDKRMEGDTSGATRYWNRVFAFERVIDSPIPPGWTSIYPPKVVSGNLHAKPLNMITFQTAPADGTELGVGTLSVVMSVNQESDDNYTHAYPAKIIGAYKNRDPQDKLTCGIAPTHELEFRAMGDTVSKSRQGNHRRHFDQTRFGTKPWAKIIFYYRSRMAIENAGCVSHPDHYVDLEPVTDGSFAAVEPEPRKTKHKTTAKTATDIDGNDEGDGIAVQSKRKDSFSSIIAESSKKPAKKPKPVDSPVEQLTSNGLFVSPSPSEMNDETESQHDRNEEVRIKIEPAEKPKTTTATTHAVAEPDVSISPPSNDNTPVLAPLTLKRPFPSGSISRESTPSKRYKISELQAKKAAMLTANQEKLKRKLAAEKKLEEDRKQREAEEAELLREIAEMEKEGMDLDEATEEVEKIREIENSEMEVD